MQQGYAPEGGKRMTPHHYRVAKGVSEITILLPILGECWLQTNPKALPWADLFWPFRPSANFHSSEQDWWVSYPFVLLSDMKGGIMSFCPSVINKGVGASSPPLGRGGGGCQEVGFYLPSLGERLRVGELRSGMGSGWVFCLICSNAPLENTLQRTENALKPCNHLIHNALTPYLPM